MSVTKRPRSRLVTLGDIIDGMDPRSDHNWWDLIEVELPGHDEAMENGEQDDFALASQIEAAYLNEHMDDIYEVRWPEHVIGRDFSGDASYILIADSQFSELYGIIGCHAPSPTNADGVGFYFDAGEELPYRIACGYDNESFATYDELVEAAKKWKESLDQA